MYGGGGGGGKGVRGVVSSPSAATQQISFPRWETLVGLTVGCDVVGPEVGCEEEGRTEGDNFEGDKVGGAEAVGSWVGRAVG